MIFTSAVPPLPSSSPSPSLPRRGLHARRSRAPAIRSTRTRQRRLRVSPLLAEARLRAAERAARGDATISARATQDLSSFNLDLRGFKVRSVTVNGAPPRFTRKDQELTITPSAGLRRDRDFTVRVVYAGHANYVVDRQVEGRLDPHGRRRIRRERAAGLADLVPGERHAEGLRDLRLHLTVPEAGPRSRTATSSRRPTAATRRPGAGARTSRWSPTSPPRRTASSSCAPARGERAAEYNAVDPRLAASARRPRAELAWHAWP